MFFPNKTSAGIISARYPFLLAPSRLAIGITFFPPLPSFCFLSPSLLSPFYRYKLLSRLHTLSRHNLLRMDQTEQSGMGIPARVRVNTSALTGVRAMAFLTVATGHFVFLIRKPFHIDLMGEFFIRSHP